MQNKRNVTIAIIIIYLISCFCPAISGRSGIRVLVSGLYLVAVPKMWPYFVCWCSNFFLYSSVFKLTKNKKFSKQSAIGLLLAITTFPLFYLNNFKFLFDTRSHISLQIGYYLWLLSFFILPFNRLILTFKKKRPEQ